MYVYTYIQHNKKYIHSIKKKIKISIQNNIHLLPWTFIKYVHPIWQIVLASDASYVDQILLKSIDSRRINSILRQIDIYATHCKNAFVNQARMSMNFQEFVIKQLVMLVCLLMSKFLLPGRKQLRHYRMTHCQDSFMQHVENVNITSQICQRKIVNH